MANGTFFKSWQLWEEMTFVLAMGIVIVFISGLIKLWSSNRRMRKVEQIDAEKQARLTQMRKSGLSANGRCRPGSEIPFGVKALDGGVEVDGIWVAKMASMASQPPNRKWSSRRKAKNLPKSAIEMRDLDSPNTRPRVKSRGSRRASKISRREILEPSHQTREKLENIFLLEEPDEVMGEEQARAAHQGHKGPLGRLQLSLKKMTSLEMWQDQERKENTGRVDISEFWEKTQAKKPQRFYPGSSTSSGTTTPIVAPKARSHTAQHRLATLLTTHGASQVEGPPRNRYITEGCSPPAAGLPRRDQADFQHMNVDDFAAQQAQIHHRRRQGSLDSRFSSSDSFVTRAEAPKKASTPVRDSGPHVRRSSEDRRAVRDAPVIPVRRSSRNSSHGTARQSTEDKRSEERSDEAAQTASSPTVPNPRYPPNSSRSGPVVQRSRSSSQHQKQQQQIASTPPSPRSDLGEAYANTSQRKVNMGFEILPAGTFGQSNEQQYNPRPVSEPVSRAASERSSIDSQSSHGRRKLQKKRTRES